MVINFKKVEQQFDNITVNCKLELEAVSRYYHIQLPTMGRPCVNNVIKKANKRLYFLILLKRAKSLLVISSSSTALADRCSYFLSMSKE